MLRVIARKTNRPGPVLPSAAESLSDALSVLTAVRCPECGVKGDFIRWGSYERSIVDLRPEDASGAAAQEGRRMQVQRVRCRSCVRTHAVLIMGIVPYRVHTLPFILRVQEEYYAAWSPAAVCRKYGIAQATLYYWKALVNPGLHMTAEEYVPPEIWFVRYRTQDHSAFVQGFLLRDHYSFRLQGFFRCTARCDAYMEQCHPVAPGASDGSADSIRPALHGS